MSLHEEKNRLFFDVLFVHLSYSDPKLSRFFSYRGGPLVSILKLKSYLLIINKEAVCKEIK